jgi:MFS family permease
MAEAAIAIAYPEPWNRGKALGYWLTYRLSGQILGGAINLGLNADRNEAGKVSYTVYLIFIALQAVGPFVALLLSKPHQVQRKDGVTVKLEIDKLPSFELKETARLFFTKKFLLVVLFIGQAVFAESVFFTYLACKTPRSSFTYDTNWCSVVFCSIPCSWIFLGRHRCRHRW